jgi:YHS domain-containing protein
MWFRLALAAAFIFVVAKLLTFLIRLFNRKSSEPQVEAANLPHGASEMVRDPVCGLYVPVDEAFREVKDGRASYFCSDKCRREFLKNKR